MSLIKEAQTLSSLTESELTFYTNAKKSLGLTYVYEAVEALETSITPEDYHKWMGVITNHASDVGVDITKQHEFEDIAWEVLDNDPKMDVADVTEDQKIRIVSTLWHTFNAMKSHDDFQSSVGNAEDEEQKAPVKDHPDTKLMDIIRKSEQLHQVYKSGMNTGGADAKAEDKKPTKSPYTPQSLRDKAWKLGYKHGVVGK